MYIEILDGLLVPSFEAAVAPGGKSIEAFTFSSVKDEEPTWGRKMAVHAWYRGVLACDSDRKERAKNESLLRSWRRLTSKRSARRFNTIRMFQGLALGGGRNERDLLLSFVAVF